MTNHSAAVVAAFTYNNLKELFEKKYRFKVCALSAVKKKPSVLYCCLMWQKSKKIPELRYSELENGRTKAGKLRAPHKNPA